MSKAAELPIVDPWPAEGLPINVAFERIAKPLWDAYLAAPRPIGVFIVPGSTTASEHDLARHSRPQAALDALLRKCVSPPAEFELWARPDRPMADLTLVPASQLGDLKIDYTQRTARWSWDRNAGPSLYDLHLRRVAGPARTDATAVPAGTPGRPTAAHLVDVEAKRRIDLGKVAPREGGLTKFSQDLATWWEDRRRDDPELPTLTPKTIANRTRKLWNSKLGTTPA
jgi:hypothetical protein